MMKRFIAMLFALLLALNLCACDVNAPTTDPTETTVVTAPTDTTVVTDPTGTTDVTEPVDTTGPTTDTTEPSGTVNPIEYDDLTNQTGIDVEYDFNSDTKTFAISLIWTNKLDTAVPFAGTYLLDVFQGDTELGGDDMTADELTTLLTAVEPGAAMTITLRFDLIDTTTPVVIKFGDANANAYFTTFTYDLTAVG